jgi:hypothetical protein
MNEMNVGKSFLSYIHVVDLELTTHTNHFTITFENPYCALVALAGCCGDKAIS